MWLVNWALAHPFGAVLCAFGLTQVCLWLDGLDKWAEKQRRGRG